MGFKPGWKITLFCLALFPVLIALGNWQLGRAQEKADILAQVALRRQMAPVDYSTLLAEPDPAYLQVVLQGQYLEGRDILLDNRTYQGRFGYEWMQPFQLDTGEQVLISRGWVPGSHNRDELPQLSFAEGARQLTAEVYVPLGSAFTLAETVLPQGWPKRVQVIDTEELGAELGVTLYPHVLRLLPGEETALIPYWQDVNVSPQKHTGYAVQWYAMAVALLLMYAALGFGWLRPGARTDASN